jgi:endogenous inhibitor of DNA gyrase (YacG/DUF329 family)
MRCPVCHREFAAESSTTLPFCSDRCRKIDLGRWLGETYTVPVEKPDDEESEVEE